MYKVLKHTVITDDPRGCCSKLTWADHPRVA